MNQSKLEVITLVADAKRRKTGASESRLVLVLLLIAWKIGANFLSQSCSVANAKPITFRHQEKMSCRHSNENRSIELYRMTSAPLLGTENWLLSWPTPSWSETKWAKRELSFPSNGAPWSHAMKSCKAPRCAWLTFIVRQCYLHCGVPV